MGISQPFKPIILVIVGGLLLGLTALLLVASLDLNVSPAATESTRSADTTVLATESPGAEASPVTTLTPTPHSRVSPVEATETPILEITENGGVPPDKTATAQHVETAPSGPGPDDVQSTVLPTATVSFQGTILVPDEWRRVEVSELDISFEVPAAWHRLGEEWAWSPDGEDRPRTGFVWSDRKRAAEMLPGALSVLHQEPLDLGWTEASSFRLERRQGEDLVAAEWHVVVQLGDEYTGDFYASGRSLQELASIDLVLSHLLSTIAFRSTPGGPVETSIGFLSAVMRDPSGVEAQLYLSNALLGESTLVLLNLNEVYSSFSVSLLPAIDGRIAAQAMLNHPGGQVEERVLFLIIQDDGWRIEEIVSRP